MNQRRANVTVNVFAEKSAIYVLDDNNETKVSVSLDVSPIKVFVGDSNGDFITYAEVLKLLNESDGVTTVHNAQRLGGYPADHYPRKAENALITGAWRHTGPLALGGNFFGEAALHNEGETILGGNAFLGGDVVSRGGAQAGFSGYGLWYRKEDNHLMIDNLTVRKAMRVYELIVNQIRGTNGSLWVSDTVKIVSAEETATVWRCFIDTNDASSIVPFREGDLIRSQRWTGKGVKYYSSKVVATATDFFELDKETWDGWDIPEAEDVLVRFGNVDDQDRQGALYLTSSDTDAPYMDVIDGVDSFDLAGKTKVRLGKLNGIFYNTEQLAGYGLYADRALLTGAIRNLDGQWALNEDGSGTLAGGAIQWTAGGVLTIGSRNPSEYALNEDVLQFNTTINNINNTVSEILGDVTQLNTDFSDIEGDISEINTLNSELLQRINSLADKKNTKYVSATQPVAPENGFVIGDEWVKETEIPGDEITYQYDSYMWFGSSWEVNKTVIDGARITTGIIDAARIIAKDLFAQEIGAVKLSVVEGHVGGFVINNTLTAEDAQGRGITLDPINKEISLRAFEEGYGVSQILIKADTLTPEAELTSSGGLGFRATAPSSEFNIRKSGSYINSNDTRATAGFSFTTYVGKGTGDKPAIYTSSPGTSSRIVIDPGKSYTADLPYTLSIYHSGASRNGRHHKLHGDLVVKVTSRLIGVTASGSTKTLVSNSLMQTEITRSTRETEAFHRTITRKASFYSQDCVSAYWILEINLKGDLTYQQWTSQLFGHYWMTSESMGIDYRCSIPSSFSIDASLGIMEIATSGLQFMWSDTRSFRIDGKHQDHFIESKGKWVHDGDFQLNGSDIVTIDNISSAIASDLSAYATKNYVDTGFYTRSQSDGRYAKLSGDIAQDFHVKDLHIAGQVNQWLAKQLVVDDARIQVNRKQDGVTVDSGLVIYDKDTKSEVSALVYDEDGVWNAGGNRLFTEAYNPKLGGYSAASYPRKEEEATITGTYTFNNGNWNGHIKLKRNAYETYITMGGAGGLFLNGGTGGSLAVLNGRVGINITAPTQALHVAGNGLFTGNLTAVNAVLSGTLGVTGNVTAGAQLSSPSYASGFGGSGWRLEGGAETHLTIDRLTVRGRMDIYELVVNQIRGTNGALWVSDSAKVASVSGNRLTIDTGGSTSFVPFVVNDLLRCQRWTGNNVKYYVVRVTAVGSNYIDVALVAGSSPREAGDHLVRMGNTTVTDRQGAIYLTSSDSNAPYMDVLDGVNSASFAGKTKVRLGRLDGITDPDLGTLSGYGLYTENGYFKGKIQVTGGNAATKADVDAVQVGGRNLLRNTGGFQNLSAWTINATGGSITIASNVDGVPAIAFAAGTNGMYQLVPVTNLVNGGIYTVSFWAKAIDTASEVQVGFLNQKDMRVTKTITAGWAVYQATFAAPIATSKNTFFHFYGTTNTGAGFYIKNIKLELGNRATDWTPAPEDVDAGIASAQSAAKSYTDTLKNRVETTLGLAALEGINQTLITGGKVRTALLEATEIKSLLITAENIEGLTLNFDKGKIGGWSMGAVSIASENKFVRLHKTSGIVVSNTATTDNVFANNNRVNMYYSSPTDWGLSGRRNGNMVFQLGSTNQIAGINFDDSKLSTENWELNKDGSASFAGGLIKILADGNTTIGDVHVDAGGALVVKEGTDNRVLITKDDITTLAAIASSTQNTTVNNSIYTTFVFSNGSVNQPNAITVNNNGTRLTVTGTFGLQLRTEAGQRNSQATLSASVYLRKVGDGVGTGVLISSRSVTVNKLTGVPMSDVVNNISLNKVAVVSAGQYRIVADFYYRLSGPGPNEGSYYTAVLDINATSMHALYDGAFQRNEIGKNGIGVITNANNYSFFGKEGSTYKAVEKVSNAIMYDKPGVLFAGSIASAGGLTAGYWGAKYRAGSYREGNNIYRIHHNVGHLNYYVHLTPHSDARMWVISKTTTYVRVQASLASLSFDFAITGNNQ